jgi:hypothetical protein
MLKVYTRSTILYHFVPFFGESALRLRQLRSPLRRVSRSPNGCEFAPQELRRPGNGFGFSIRRWLRPAQQELRPPGIGVMTAAKAELSGSFALPGPAFPPARPGSGSAPTGVVAFP